MSNQDNAAQVAAPFVLPLPPTAPGQMAPDAVLWQQNQNAELAAIQAAYEAENAKLELARHAWRQTRERLIRRQGSKEIRNTFLNCRATISVRGEHPSPAAMSEDCAVEHRRLRD